MFLARKIQRDEGKTLACAARGEDNVIVVAEPHELLDVCLCLLVDFVVGGGAVTGLEDGYSRAAEVQQLRLYFPEDILGQNGRAGIEVINAFVHGISPSVRYDFVGASAAERMGNIWRRRGMETRRAGKRGISSQTSHSSVSVRVMRIWATRARSMRSTSKVKSSHVQASPTDGMRPICAVTKPPRV